MKYIIALASLCIFLGLFVFSIPYILSSHFGITLVEKYLHQKYHVSVSMQSLKLRWLGPQEVKDIRLLCKNDTITIESATLPIPLVNLFFRPHALVKDPQDVAFLHKIEIASDPKTTLDALQFRSSAHRTFVITGSSTTPNGNGTLQIEGLHEWKIDLNQFPTAFLQFFQKTLDSGSFPLEMFLGPTFSSHMLLSLQNGTHAISLDLIGHYLHLSTQGNYSGGFFFPQVPTEIGLVLTGEMSSRFFANASVRPISATQITIRIEPSGSSIPLHPFTCAKLNIPHLSLNLGKINFKNFGTLSDLLSLVQLRPRLNSDVLFWFQEAPLTIKEGQAHVERTEMLVDHRYEMALYGDIDFCQKEFHMYLGLTKDTLQHAFGIKNLPNAYIIPMRMDGPFDNIHIHKSRALKKIALLIALEKASLPIPTDFDAPPSRHPFPWER